jgi:hypothetical protein
MRTKVVTGLLCGAAVALTGCGAREAEVVKGAFEKDIKSANIELAIATHSDGEAFNLSLRGPYRSNGEGKLPSADLDVKIEGAAPKPLSARLISTGENAFVEYEGETYEVGEERIAELEREGAGGSADQLTPADIRKLTATMGDWFPDSDAQEDAELDGEPVTRVTGKLDLSKALTDLKALASRPGMSGVEELKQLSAADIRRLARMVADPRFTVDVAKSDGKLRRIEAKVRVERSATLDVSLRFKDVDKPVEIDAPKSGRPIEELGRRLEQQFGGTEPETTVS